MLILTINSVTDTDCTGVKADSDGNLGVNSCYDLTFDSGKVSCIFKQKKIVVVDKVDTDTAKKNGEELVKKDSSLLEVKITCKSTGDVKVESEVIEEAENYKKKCDEVKNPSADSCAAITDSTANGKGYYCCFQQKNYTDNTKDNDETNCEIITKSEYRQLEALMNEELKKANENGNSFTNFVYDGGAGKTSLKGAGTEIKENNIDGKKSGVSLLKTGVIISIFALLILIL